MPSRAIRAQMQIGKPRLPEHGAIVSQAGDGDGEWLLQASKAGKGRAPVRSAELEPGDRGIAAVPADDPPGEGVGLGRPGDSQLITSHPNKAEGIRTRAFRTAPGGAGSALMPVTIGCRLTAHAHIRAILATIPRPANLFAGSSQRPAAANNVVRSARVALWRKRNTLHAYGACCGDRSDP